MSGDRPLSAETLERMARPNCRPALSGERSGDLKERTLAIACFTRLLRWQTAGTGGQCMLGRGGACTARLLQEEPSRRSPHVCADSFGGPNCVGCRATPGLRMNLWAP